MVDYPMNGASCALLALSMASETDPVKREQAYARYRQECAGVQVITPQPTLGQMRNGWDTW